MPFADPEQQRAYQRNYKRLQRAGGRESNSRSNPVAGRVSFEDGGRRAGVARRTIRRRATECLVRLGQRAKAVGYLAGISLRAIDAGDVADWAAEKRSGRGAPAGSPILAADVESYP